MLKENDYVTVSNVKELLDITMSWKECRPKKGKKTSSQCTIPIVSNGKAKFFHNGKCKLKPHVKLE
jgi:hypothetical protein